MLVGADKAKSLGLDIITLTGFSFDNPLRKLGDTNFWVDSDKYNIVEMTHHIWLLAIADYIIDQDNKK
jgi:D-sedoheptulose 7-phosphate isomerase